MSDNELDNEGGLGEEAEENRGGGVQDSELLRSVPPLMIY